MIAIIGATEDDVNYIVIRLINSEPSSVAGLPVYIGHLGGTKVVVGYSGKGEELASILTTLIIEKYDPYLVINVGTVSSIDDTLPQGSLFMCDRIYYPDVDFTPIGRYSFGQFPGFPSYFASATDLINRLRIINNQLNNEVMKVGGLISSNKFFTKKEEVTSIIKRNYLNVDHIFAVDNESAGVALACSIYDIPYFGLKVVANEVGREEQLLTRVRHGILKTPIVGQYITNLFYDFDDYVEE